MKKYIDAQLQVVRMNNRDIVTESLNAHIDVEYKGTEVYGADRFRDWE